jgi:hypothetical protein
VSLASVCGILVDISWQTYAVWDEHLFSKLLSSSDLGDELVQLLRKGIHSKFISRKGRFVNWIKYFYKLLVNALGEASIAIRDTSIMYND